MKRDDLTLIEALRDLATYIKPYDEKSSERIAEAADRLAELTAGLTAELTAGDITIADEILPQPGYARLLTAELTAGHITIPGCVGVITMIGDTAASHAAQAIYLPEQEIRVKR